MAARGGPGAAQASGQKVRGRYGAATDRLDAIAAQAIDQARHLPNASQWWCVRVRRSLKSLRTLWASHRPSITSTVKTARAMPPTTHHHMTDLIV